MISRADGEYLQWRRNDNIIMTDNIYPVRDWFVRQAAGEVERSLGKPIPRVIGVKRLTDRLKRSDAGQYGWAYERFVRIRLLLSDSTFCVREIRVPAFEEDMAEDDARMCDPSYTIHENQIELSILASKKIIGMSIADVNFIIDRMRDETRTARENAWKAREHAEEQARIRNEIERLKSKLD